MNYPLTIRRFWQKARAFFQQSAEEAEAEAFTIDPADFALVNPNTGTAPVFRTQRDAEIVLRAYRHLPVLALRALYPVRYLRMFDMTNDSDLFQTADELETGVLIL